MRTLGKLAWVEIKLFIREPITMVFTFALPVIFLFVMGGVFGNIPDPDVYRGVGPTDYYLPAYIALTICSVSLVGLPVHLTAYRERGILRRLRASSISIWSVFGSQVIVSFFIAILGGILLTVIALLVYDIHLAVSPGLVIPAFIYITIAFAAIGIFLGAVLPTTRAAQGVGLILFFVMLILGGAGPPREVLSVAMQWVGDMMPLRWAIVLLQDPWLGFGWNYFTFGIVSAFGIVAAVLSLRFFRWE